MSPMNIFENHVQMARKKHSLQSSYRPPTNNPFLETAGEPFYCISTKDIEPISMIDEEEFIRKFQDIAMFADMDDVDDDAALLHATCNHHTINVHALSDDAHAFAFSGQ